MVSSVCEQAGATHASLYTMDRGFTEVGQHIDYMTSIMATARGCRCLTRRTPQEFG